MVVLARADLLYAVVGYLRSFTELTALVSSVGGWKGSGSGPRIAASRRGGENGWNLPTRAVWVKKSGGPIVGDDYTMGLKRTRIDVTCYGATGDEADSVWAMVDAILVPEQGVRSAGFVVDAGDGRSIRISNVIPEADATSLIDPDARWPYVFQPYLLDWITA